MVTYLSSSTLLLVSFLEDAQKRHLKILNPALTWLIRDSTAEVTTGSLALDILSSFPQLKLFGLRGVFTSSQLETPTWVRSSILGWDDRQLIRAYGPV